jgi:UDP-N-acetyl-D-glucosamine dehydrogenase
VNELEQKIRDKTAVVGVIGLGYVGLPLAVTFAEAGFPVIGLDQDISKINKIHSGESYIVDVESARLREAVTRHGMESTSCMSDLDAVDAVMICVPTPFTPAKNPDLQYVISAGRSIARYALSKSRPVLVVLESTTYPGSTRSDLLPVLSDRGQLDKDFFLAFSPEMIDPGNKTFGTANIPKIVGGISPESTLLAKLLYKQVCDSVVGVSSPEVAELVKVFTNTFRNVNIALVNELAQLCEKMGVSVWEVADTAAKKPFGFMSFYPGPGPSGHCIPKDPYYLSHKAMELGFHARFIELATHINEQMPEYVLGEVMRAMNTRGAAVRGAQVLVLGVAFKKDIADTRESTAIKLIDLLEQQGANVQYHDPYVPFVITNSHRYQSVDISPVSRFDCVVIATDHTSLDYEGVIRESKLVYDTRGITRFAKVAQDNVYRLGEPTHG